MPSTYAHYRFGVQMLEKMDPALKRKIQRFRNVYDVGLHGPDLFFYYNPLFPTAPGKLGGKFHQQTGEAFFSAAARRLRMKPNDVGTAYLFGVLGHYCLDSAVHPLVNETAKEGKISHTELEAEFERFLLTMDRKIPAHVQDFSGHMKLSPGECITVAELYPGSKPGHIRQGVGNMAKITKLLASRNRKTTEALLGFAGKEAAQMLLPRTPNENCAFLDDAMLALYNDALERCPAMEAALRAHLETGEPLGEMFQPIFG